MSAARAVRATAKATPASDWAEPTGLREARAATAAARERLADLHLAIETAMHDHRNAVVRRKKLIDRTAAGEDVDPSAVAAAAAAAADAEARIALRREAVPVAEEAVRRAENDEVFALRDAVVQREREAAEDTRAAKARRDEAVSAYNDAWALERQFSRTLADLVLSAQSPAKPSPAGLIRVLALPRVGGGR